MLARRPVLTVAEFSDLGAAMSTGERSTCVPSLRMRPASKCLAWREYFSTPFSVLQEINQNGAVIRFREFGPQRTVSSQIWSTEVNSSTSITLENKKKIPH